MNISKEQFINLAKEHLIALESYKMDKNGNTPIEIFGIEKLYEAIDVIHSCESDSELLPTLLKNTNRVEVIDQQGRTYVNWKPTNKVELSLQDNERTLKVFIND
jgi:hypothetical protein